MHKKLFNKLWGSSKKWFLRAFWPHVRTRRALLLTFVIFIIAILVCMMLWSWIVANQELAAGFLTSLVLAIGLYFAYAQFKLIKKTEQARLIKDMSAYWDSQIVRDGRKALWEAEKSKRRLSDEFERCKEQEFEKWLLLTRVGNFFEEMGSLARDKALDLRIIAGRFRTHIIDYYELYKPFIEKHKIDQPTIYENFKWLAEEIQKVEM